ncbi:MAG: AbgT family transporter [Hyphomonadaceae bacterium JAD_PAG50586_4]|nr:MAG: AbgT family transporter [Hyphomonadaceae bacterium JAD_PAG50586_4]
MAEATQERQKGILGLIKRAGNKLPDPVLIFFWLIGILIAGSASAKWALMAPVPAPMIMLLGVSPEMTTAACRVGDGATNIITR